MATVTETLADGRYQLHGPLGSGGAASVYRATDTRLGVQRAIKLLTGPATARATLRRRLAAEARVMARLDHPNILRVFDIGTDGVDDFIVMELAQGGSLADWLERDGPLRPGTAIGCALQILSALAAAHAAGVVHRDVKPQNVLLDANAKLMLADFGIALISDEVVRGTRAGVAMGSLAYMAPEQRLDAREVGPSADIYAAGATLFHLLTGSNPVDLFAAAETSPRWATVPPGLVAILRRATAYEPSARFASCGELASALLDAQRVIGDAPALARPSASPSHGAAATVVPNSTDSSDVAGFVASTNAAVTLLEAHFPDARTPTMASSVVSSRGVHQAVSDTELEAFADATPSPRRRRAPVLLLASIALLLIFIVARWSLGTATGPAAPTAAGGTIVSEPAITPDNAALAEPAPGVPGVAAPGPTDPDNAEAAPDPVVDARVATEPASKPPPRPAPAPLAAPTPAVSAASKSGSVPRPAEAPRQPLAGLEDAGVHWSGSFGGKPCDMVLKVSGDVVKGAVVSRFAGNEIVSYVSGTYQPQSREVVLQDDDVADASSGWYKLTVFGDWERAEGSFEGRHNGHQTRLVLRAAQK